MLRYSQIKGQFQLWLMCTIVTHGHMRNLISGMKLRNFLMLKVGLLKMVPLELSLELLVDTTNLNLYKTSFFTNIGQISRFRSNLIGERNARFLNLSLIHISE